MVFIKVSIFGRPDEVGDFLPASQAWPDDTFLQAGFKGLVFSHSDEGSYVTVYVEAFPADSGFFRGEGETIGEAELAAWNKYEASLNCAEHEWEARGYRNGAGFCKHCNMFRSGVFDVAVVGNPCEVCKVGTNWSCLSDDDGVFWYCEEHVVFGRLLMFGKLSDKVKAGVVLSDVERISFNVLLYHLDGDEDE